MPLRPGPQEKHRATTKRSGLDSLDQTSLTDDCLDGPKVAVGVQIKNLSNCSSPAHTCYMPLLCIARVKEETGFAVFAQV